MISEFQWNLALPSQRPRIVRNASYDASWSYNALGHDALYYPLAHCTPDPTRVSQVHSIYNKCKVQKGYSI